MQKLTWFFEILPENSYYNNARKFDASEVKLFFLCFTEKNKEAVFVVTKHGGHLGFYEGGILLPNKITWLDHVLVEYILAMENAIQSLKYKSETCDDVREQAKKCFSL